MMLPKLLSRYKKVVLHLKHIFRTSSLCRQTFEDVYAQFDEAAMYFELKEMESITHIDSDLATAVANDTMIRQFPLCYQHKNMKSRN